MAEGIPLNDQDRIPWLCRLHDILMREHASGQNTILACSALKKMYRRILENGEAGTNCENPSGRPEEPGEPASQKILFIHLDGPMDLIAQRMAKRRGHFMPPELLQSQFEALEAPSPPENSITVSLEKPVSEIVAIIEEYVRNRYG
uniref:probable gluconokinase n=1 Tax=Euleptes europaea TaxID=460621 RepID=UPI00254108D0|nr:probable gluconokinase [Euleptes europaea]